MTSILHHFATRHFTINCHGGEVVMDLIDNQGEFRRFTGALEDALEWAVSIWRESNQK